MSNDTKEILGSITVLVLLGVLVWLMLSMKLSETNQPTETN